MFLLKKEQPAAAGKYAGKIYEIEPKQWILNYELSLKHPIELKANAGLGEIYQFVQPYKQLISYYTVFNQFLI